jgi:transcriptional regulator with XRE-family HTH domain
MEGNKTRLVTIEESNENFASSSDHAREIQEISYKISELMDSLVKEREAKHLSQRDLAKLLDWKQPALARMERLEVIPRLDTFLKAVMKVGGNVYIEYFDQNIPTQCIKSSQYISSLDLDNNTNTYTNNLSYSITGANV